MCTFKTSPCVPAPRAHVETSARGAGRGRFERTHGGVSESTYGFFPWFFSVSHTKHTPRPPTTPHRTHTTHTTDTTCTPTHTTQHNTTSHGDGDRETEKQGRERREDERGETRQDNRRQKKTGQHERGRVFNQPLRNLGKCVRGGRSERGEGEEWWWWRCVMESRPRFFFLGSEPLFFSFSLFSLLFPSLSLLFHLFEHRDFQQISLLGKKFLPTKKADHFKVYPYVQLSTLDTNCHSKCIMSVRCLCGQSTHLNRSSFLGLLSKCNADVKSRH